MTPASPPASRDQPLIGWRLLALLYDTLPAIGLWFLVAAIFVALHQDSVRGGALGLLEFLAMWTVTGAYAVTSWRRGGRTLGMRAWRLRVTSADGSAAPISALIRRYVLGSVSLLLAGGGFWWAWRDADGLTLHDRFSGTRMQREQKTPLA